METSTFNHIWLAKFLFLIQDIYKKTLGNCILENANHFLHFCIISLIHYAWKSFSISIFSWNVCQYIQSFFTQRNKDLRAFNHHSTWMHLQKENVDKTLKVTHCKYKNLKITVHRHNRTLWTLKWFGKNYTTGATYLDSCSQHYYLAVHNAPIISSMTEEFYRNHFRIEWK